MWAQGLTIGVIIGAGVLTQSQRQKQFEERVSSYCWLAPRALADMPCAPPAG